MSVLKSNHTYRFENWIDTSVKDEAKEWGDSKNNMAAKALIIGIREIKKQRKQQSEPSTDK